MKSSLEKDIAFYQMAYTTIGDTACAKAIATNFSDAPAKCKPLKTGLTAKDASKEYPSIAYFKRGVGYLPLQGVEDYTRFSNIVFNDDTILPKDPTKLYTEFGQFYNW